MPRRIDPIIWQHKCHNAVDLLAREAGLSWQEICHQNAEVLRLRATIANNRKG